MLGGEPLNKHFCKTFVKISALKFVEANVRNNSSVLVLKFQLYPPLRLSGERGGSVVECQTPKREVRGSRPTAAVLCPLARHFTPPKYWLITQEAMAPFRHDWKIVDWDVKPQHNQPTQTLRSWFLNIFFANFAFWLPW